MHRRRVGLCRERGVRLVRRTGRKRSGKSHCALVGATALSYRQLLWTRRSVASVASTSTVTPPSMPVSPLFPKAGVSSIPEPGRTAVLLGT